MGLYQYNNITNKTTKTTNTTTKTARTKISAIKQYYRNITDKTIQQHYNKHYK